ncbi:MAG TPA: ABC transporter permease [Methylophilaceae bacterium]
MTTLPQRLWVLYCKEWFRIRRNPSALMAVGLVVLMAFLVSIETKATTQAAAIASRPCLVVHRHGDPLAEYLQRTGDRPTVRFVAVDHPLSPERHPDYPPQVTCAVEIGEAVIDGSRRFSLVFRHGGDVRALQPLTQWLLAELGAYGGEPLIQSTLPLQHSEAQQQNRGKIDLASKQSRAMVNAMLIFSAQFFVCCTLFISFTAHERERGILQALSLTTSSPFEILLAKMLFHLTLALASGILIIGIVGSWQMLKLWTLWWMLLFSSLGLMAIAILITSLTRLQSSAGLIGFCYIMLIGVVFALSQNFPAFGMIRLLMFEHHFINGIRLFFDWQPAQAAVFHENLVMLAVMGSLSMGLALWIWRWRGWRQP